MPALVLLRGFQISRANYAVSRLYHVGRAASVDTAIARGIRKSNGVGLRGKSKPAENDPREKYMERKGIPEYKRLPRDDAAGVKAQYSSSSRGRKGEEDVRIRRGKRDIKPGDERRPGENGHFKKPSGGGRKMGRTGSSDDRKGFPDRSSFDNLPARAEDTRSTGDFTSRTDTRGGKEFLGSGDRNTERPRYSSPKYPSLEGSNRDIKPSHHQNKSPNSLAHYTNDRRDKSRNVEEVEPRTWSGPASDSKPPTFFNRKTGKFELYNPDGGYGSRDKSSDVTKPKINGGDLDFAGTQDSSSLIRRTNKFDPRSSDGYQKPSYRSRDFTKPQRGSSNNSFSTPSSKHESGRSEPRSSDDGQKLEFRSSGYTKSDGNFNFTVDRNIPMSIPYTTPASEFLYGTSVVEAALSSRRIPRRKLYKLYIYTGENRENPDQDRTMEKLARNEGVEVVKVAGEWIRLLDKMSTGRPHNGYILEASPLPKLPVLSLGAMTVKDGLDGFQVALDYQSREDAAVNGTGTFVRNHMVRSRRHPLVLYLDSITDPGNMGGIIRTAAFLGVSAVAISSRNSAPFTPVVLKASAGASENVTIFSVDKPAGFIVDSKAAGWKVYAAVAPTKKKNPGMPASISTNSLDDPLADHPCILMLGSEGEGLRWNLRSKADSDLFIRSSGQNYNVDSLNVSVAAGLLVNAFLRKNSNPRPNKGEVTDSNEIKDSESYDSDVEDAIDPSEEVEAEDPAPEKGENALF